jgi:hypothetical protein
MNPRRRRHNKRARAVRNQHLTAVEAANRIRQSLTGEDWKILDAARMGNLRDSAAEERLLEDLSD